MIIMNSALDSICLVSSIGFISMNAIMNRNANPIRTLKSRSVNASVLLNFSEHISDDTFDAESIENLGDLGAVVADTNDVDGTFQKFGIPDYMIRHS